MELCTYQAYQVAYICSRSIELLLSQEPHQKLSSIIYAHPLSSPQQGVRGRYILREVMYTYALVARGIEVSYAACNACRHDFRRKSSTARLMFFFSGVYTPNFARSYILDYENA